MRHRSDSVGDIGEGTVDALRVLFDILDTEGTGRISFEKLAGEFFALPKPRLPPSFLHCAARLTSPTGHLSFDRFLDAVRLSIRDHNNNSSNLHRVQSEGHIPQPDRRRVAMGVNGFDRRSAYGSHPNVAVDRPSPPTYENVSHVVMRKKPSTVRSQKEDYRSRQPMTHQNGVAPMRPAQRFRPVSTNSYNSIASSGMENVVWRNSVMSNGSNERSSDDSPRVAKLERLHSEEEEIVRRGLEKATKLVEWYRERLETLDKRNRLLSKGVVALDPSVPEQRLNFLRAQVSELNRRMLALMESSERGFPSHQKMVATGSVTASGNASSTRTTPPRGDPHFEALQLQNRRLSQELVEKTRMIEELRREGPTGRRMTPAIHRPSAFVRPAPHTPIRTANSPVKVYDTLM